MIRFSCGHCGKKYLVRNEVVGRLVRCSGCGREFHVPSQTTQKAEPPPVQVPPPLPRTLIKEPEPQKSSQTTRPLWKEPIVITGVAANAGCDLRKLNGRPLDPFG